MLLTIQQLFLFMPIQTVYYRMWHQRQRYFFVNLSQITATIQNQTIIPNQHINTTIQYYIIKTSHAKSIYPFQTKQHAYRNDDDDNNEVPVLQQLKLVALLYLR